jgi:hypothetical protein
MSPAADDAVGLSLSSRPERGYVIAALSGELDRPQACSAGTGCGPR